MANFTPQGVIKIGRVPFDNSYRHTMTFASRTAQTEYFQSVCLTNLDRADYTYIRMNNAIRVPFNAEQLYTCNYVMYQNANYGSKWFYAFIVGVNYLNENATELVLELDVMQTWYFDYTLEEGFVEREHVADDSIGAHLNAEPAMDLEYKVQDKKEQWEVPQYVIVMANAYPHWNQSRDSVMGSDPYSGGVYHNQYNACKFFVYNAVGTSVQRQKLADDMDAFNGAGAADTICDSFTVSSRWLQATDLEAFTDWIGTVPGVQQMAEGTQPKVWDETINRPSTHSGYEPRNNKLLTYPFTYCEVGDFTGRVQDYRFEFSGNSNGALDFKYMAPVCSDMTKYIWADHYNGVEAGDKPVSPFTVDISNKVSWVYSAYQNWAAQNALANQLAVIGSTVAVGASLMPGINAASGILGRGVAEVSALNNAGMPNFAQMAAPGWNRAGVSSGLSAVSGEGIAAGALGLGSTLANADRMKKTPNTARGSVGGNARFQAGYAGNYYAVKVLLPEFAAIVDDFFDMYGYQVDRVKVPNRTGRPNWNYVKMQNSCHRGNVPAGDMSLINSIYDSGITFWHTSDIGNYSLPNK